MKYWGIFDIERNPAKDETGRLFIYDNEDQSIFDCKEEHGETVKEVKIIPILKKKGKK